MGLPVGIDVPFRALQIAVASDDFLSFRIPDDELLVAVLADVKLVNVHLLACAATGLAESYLAQSTDLTHHVGGVVSRHNIYLVVAFIRQAQLALGSQLALEHFYGDRINDGLFHGVRN